MLADIIERSIDMSDINEALERFESLIASELKRIEKMKSQDDFVDYKTLDRVIMEFTG